MACNDNKRTYVASPINTGLEQLPEVPQIDDLGLKTFLQSVKAVLEGRSANPKRPAAIQNFTNAQTDSGTQLVWDSDPNAAFYVLYRNNTNDFSLSRVVATVHAAGGLQRPGFFDVAGQDEVASDRVYWIRGFGPTGEPGPLSSQALTVDSGVIPGDHPWTEVLTPGEVRLVEQNNADEVVVRSFGTAPDFKLMHANGTEDSPDSIESDDEIGSITFGGWGGTDEVDAAVLRAFATADFVSTGSVFTLNQTQIGGDSINGSWAATGRTLVHGMVIVDDFLYVTVGGILSDAAGARFYRYQISTATWTIVTIPIDFGVLTKPVHYNGHIYFGAADSGGGSGGRLYDYDISGATLTEIGTAAESCGSDALGVSSIALDEINGIIYTGSENTLARVNRYAIATDTWTVFSGVDEFGVTSDGITSLEVKGAYVYAGVRLFGGVNSTYEVWRKLAIGSSWARIHTSFGNNISIPDLKSYASYIYATLSSGDIFEYNPDTDVWTQIGGDGINSSWTGGNARTLFVRGTNVYAAIGGAGGTAEVWRFVPNFTGGFAGTWSQVFSTPSAAYEITTCLAIDTDDTMYCGFGSTFNADADVWQMGTETTGIIGTSDVELAISAGGLMQAIQRWYANGDIAMGFGLERVFWDESTFRLGIRTTTPARTLDVNGTEGMRLAQGSPGTPALGDLYIATTTGLLTWHDGTAARRAVHAPAALTTLNLVKGDGGVTGVQTTGIAVSSVDAVTGVTLLGLEDTDGSHNLSLKWNENDSANRTLNLLVGAANRSLTFSADATIGGTNTGDVTLAGSLDYLTMVGQVITRGPIDLTTDVTLRLPYANLVAATGPSLLLGRGDAGGGGNWQEVTLGTGFSIDGTELNFSGGAATVVTDPAGALDGDGSGGDPLAVRVDGVTVIINGSNELEATGTGGAHASTHENAGGDEIDVTGLSGELADPQPPKDHAADHADGGGDEIDVTDLGGYPADAFQVLLGNATFGPIGWRLAGTTATTGTTSTGRWTFTSNVTEIIFTSLAGWSDLLVFTRLITKGTTGTTNMTVSINNGSSFLTASGDYIRVATAGTESNAAALAFHGTNATAARSGSILIHGWNLATLKQFSEATRNISDSTVGFIPTANDLDALRIFPSGGGNITGGDVYIYGRM